MTTDNTTTATQTNDAPADVVVNTDKNVVVKEVNFHFKKDKETDVKRPTVELKLPVPSVDGIVNILKTGGKGLDLLLQACAEVVISQARSIVNSKEDVSQANFPFAEITWEAIANMPEAERKGGGISKETWEDFAKDYIAVMPGVSGKTPDQIQNAAKFFLAKFAPIKTNKPALSKLQAQLAIWFEHTTQGEELKECFTFLDEKITKLLAVTDDELAANL